MGGIEIILTVFILQQNYHVPDPKKLLLTVTVGTFLGGKVKKTDLCSDKQLTFSRHWTRKSFDPSLCDCHADRLPTTHVWSQAANYQVVVYTK